VATSSTRRSLEFRERAVRNVRETGKPIDVVAPELGINAGTLSYWVKKDRALGEIEGLSAGKGKGSESIPQPGYRRWR
jgi:transposase-like protein